MPCAHLLPLVEHLASLGIEITPCESPYGRGPYAWWSVPCVFDDVPALRARLGIDDAIVYDEQFMFSAGSEATWRCEADHVVCIGPHRRVAGPDVPRVRG